MSLQQSKHMTVNAGYRSHLRKLWAALCLHQSPVFSLQSTLQLGTLSLKMQFAAGRWASIETLQAAHALGLPWSGELLHGVARSGDVSKLQYL
jgi:hypothetical protein